MRGFPVGAHGKWVQSVGGEDRLEEGMATHSYSCVENPMDRGAWKATVHKIAKGWTQWKRLNMHPHVNKENYK